MNAIKLITLGSFAGAASLSAFEGGFDYGDLLKNAGTFYKDETNPYIQKAKFYGRAQYQFGTVLTDGERFDFTELRRTRVGLEVEFFEHFKWKGNADLDNGSVNDTTFEGFGRWDDAGLYIDLNGLFDLNTFDKLTLFAGKTKIAIGADVHPTSTKINVVERTRWTDEGLRPTNSTGVRLDGAISDATFSIGLWANIDDDDFHFWKDETSSFAYATTKFGLGPGDLLLDAIVAVGDDPGEDSAYDNDYSWSAAYITGFGGWETIFNIGGAREADFAGGDSLFGVSALAAKEIYKNLELVGRLSYATGEHFGLDASSRYAREDDLVGDDRELSNGDQAFNAYLGLNYFFHGHNAKVQFAVEYDQVENTVALDDSAVTFSSAYRLKF